VRLPYWATGAAAFICQGLVGALTGALGYVVMQKLVYKKSVTWGGIATAAVVGLIAGLGGPLGSTARGALIRIGKKVAHAIAVQLKSYVRRIGLGKIVLLVGAVESMVGDIKPSRILGLRNRWPWVRGWSSPLGR
jgi:hypothetical protein